MFDTEFIKYLTSLGVGGTVAIFIYLYSQKAIKEYTDALNRINEERKGQIEILVGLAKDVSSVLTANTKTIEAFHNRLDRLFRYEDTLKQIKDDQKEKT